MPIWKLSKRGYTTLRPDGVRVTVFFHAANDWRVTSNGEFLHGFQSAIGAVDAAEGVYGFKADREDVVDVDPDLRKKNNQPEQVYGEQQSLFDEIKTAEEAERLRKLQEARAAFAAVEEARRLAEEARKEKQRQQDEWLRRYKDDKIRESREKAKAKKEQEARDKAALDSYKRMFERERPWWAIALELQGAGPWKRPEIRAAFAILAKKYHPDVGGDEKLLQNIVKAWNHARIDCRS